MKIGIFDPYLDDLGGGEKYMMTIAEVLSKKHEVVVFWDKKEDIGELLHRFSLDLRNVRFEKNMFAKGVSFFERLQKSRAFDAIIVLSDGSIPFVLSQKLFIHIQQPLPFVQMTAKSKLKVKRVSKFFCNSSFTKSFIDKTFGVDSVVVYPPVSIQAKKYKKENIILTVGRLRVRDIVTSTNGQVTSVGDYKKQTVLVDVFKELVEAGLTDWRFVLAVSVKEDDQQAFAAIKKDAHGFPIEFLVNKTNEELWDIYARAKIYWHASGFGEDLEDHPEHAEHFGISTVEAMGAGAVPVVIRAGGQKEIVTAGENGFLWDSLDQLKEKTLVLISDEGKLKSLSEKAQARAKDFSVGRFKKQMYELIQT